MDLGTVTYAAKGGIARVVLNRPEQLNAISPSLLEDLDKVCAAVEGNQTLRAVTLQAAGRAFCAGADLKAVRELSPDPEKWARFMRLWHRVFNRIEALPVPVVAGGHGLPPPPPPPPARPPPPVLNRGRRPRPAPAGPRGG